MALNFMDLKDFVKLFKLFAIVKLEEKILEVYNVMNFLERL